MLSIVHLTASRSFGGPERQMLGLGTSLRGECRSAYLSFAEDGHSRSFLDEATRAGFETAALPHDTPRIFAAIADAEEQLRRLNADVLCCHGYKADLLGRFAARRRGIPVVAVSRGWTGADLKVNVYEAIDAFALRWMDRVVCVSDAQAVRVRQAGVPPGLVTVIRNAVLPERFAHPDPVYRSRLEAYFSRPPRLIIGAAGRLSPEKGFGVLVTAAQQVLRALPDVGLVLFGDGPLRAALTSAVETAGIADRFVFAGFRNDLDQFLPFFDLLALPSFTEGLPNVVLEAGAAGVPVVATAVGGTPEVVQDGANGCLVPPFDPGALAERILDLLASEEKRRRMGAHARHYVRKHFTFAAQATQYLRLFAQLTGTMSQGRPALAG